MNHSHLLHPHIVQFKEVCLELTTSAASRFPFGASHMHILISPRMLTAPPGALLHPHGLSDQSVGTQVFLTKDYLAIAMEYAAGGDMFQYVKHRGGLEEVEARWFFQQLIIGMDYCHKMVRAQ